MTWRPAPHRLERAWNLSLIHISLEAKGVITRAGTIVDASFVEVPRQRNSREENKLIKEGQTPEAWQTNLDKLRQKDVDARWTKKNEEVHFGYKNHVRADADSALITDYVVTPASVPASHGPRPASRHSR